MKQIKLYYNQRTQGGAVEWEAWQVEPIGNDFTYGSGECLKEITVEIPDEWFIGKDCFGSRGLADENGCPVKLTGRYSPVEVYAIAATDSASFPRKLKVIE